MPSLFLAYISTLSSLSGHVVAKACQNVLPRISVTLRTALLLGGLDLPALQGIRIDLAVSGDVKAPTHLGSPTDNGLRSGL